MPTKLNNIQTTNRIGLDDTNPNHSLVRYDHLIRPANKANTNIMIITGPATFIMFLKNSQNFSMNTNITINL